MQIIRSNGKKTCEARPELEVPWATKLLEGCCHLLPMKQSLRLPSPFTPFHQGAEHILQLLAAWRWLHATSGVRKGLAKKAWYTAFGRGRRMIFNSACVYFLVLISHIWLLFKRNLVFPDNKYSTYDALLSPNRVLTVFITLIIYSTWRDALFKDTCEKYPVFGGEVDQHLLLKYNAYSLCKTPPINMHLYPNQDTNPIHCNKCFIHT